MCYAQDGPKTTHLSVEDSLVEGDAENPVDVLVYSLSMVLRALRVKVVESRLSISASLVKRPCFQAPLALPFGAPPLAP